MESRELARMIDRIFDRLEHVASHHDIQRLEKHIMNVTEALAAYSASVQASYDSINGTANTITANITGLSVDIKRLLDTITQQNGTPGPISAQDQALLDSSQSQATALKDKLAAVSTALAALVTSTEAPPVVPVANK